jgi:hypothetical protein
MSLTSTVKLTSAERQLGEEEPRFPGGSGSRRQTGPGDRGPGREGLGTGDTICAGGQAVAGDVKEVGDRVVDGQKALNLAR